MLGSSPCTPVSKVSHKAFSWAAGSVGCSYFNVGHVPGQSHADGHLTNRLSLLAVSARSASFQSTNLETSDFQASGSASHHCWMHAGSTRQARAEALAWRPGITSWAYPHPCIGGVHWRVMQCNADGHPTPEKVAPALTARLM